MSSNKVIEYLASHKHNASITAPHYCPDGDYLLYFIDDVDCYADRVDEVLTLFFDMTNKDKIVGLKIKSIRHLRQNLDYRIDDGDGNLNLGLLIQAGMDRARRPTVRHFYREVGRLVEAIPVSATNIR